MLKLFAADFVPAGPVLDEVGILSSSQVQILDQNLREIQRANRAQIQVVILQSLQGEPIETKSIRMVEEFQLGSRDRSNGILFLVAIQDRRFRIEVGRGLEGQIPDILAGRILNDWVRPLFQKGRMGDGVVVGVEALVHLLDHPSLQDFQPQWVQGVVLPKKAPKGDEDSMPIDVWLAVLFLFLVFSGFLRAARGRGFRGGGPAGIFWGGSSWPGSGRGSGGFGGGSWGGGGGGFGGGGSSGSW